MPLPSLSERRYYCNFYPTLIKASTNAQTAALSILVDTSAEDDDDLIDTNVRSTFLFTRHTVPVSQTVKAAVDAFGRIDIIEVQMRTMAEALA